ncbi:hypothetical protein FIU86_13400 [Roseovarius sp. THAF9]|uniref:hypothetical protein n=1 Tax=Roseovarius sp. THAF9 TaxID=2587847 RepID=UPI0012695A7A|nr:hypothetical protein [Roseovarius sp. THAF9]QFT93840.1 hypothetical protein FIU86_13400 [Roseovarius sp. THAF9]
MSNLIENALLAEYNALRTEILERVKVQYIILAGIGVFASILLGLDASSAQSSELEGAVQATASSLKLERVDHSMVYLVSPVVFCVLTWLYLEQDEFITQAARYIDQYLKPTAMRIVGQDDADGEPAIFNWEQIRGDFLFGDQISRAWIWLMVFFRAIACLGPSYFVLIWLISQRVELDPYSYSSGVLDKCLILVGIFMTVVMSFSLFRVVRLYAAITVPVPNNAAPETR